MDLQLCYNASQDMFPLPLHIKQIEQDFFDGASNERAKRTEG